jgi:DNA polymerase-3 subunit gamma/tau
MDTTNLNLARKWRSKAFDQIVGQELPVRMLKNSLYLGSYFPVYLFAGQRGCGKTSMARVFAAAINCERLPEFQANPKVHTVPCLTCSSCIAMISMKHPDFIEIDAASNTGVDNVRYIIDAASLLPVMGRKKIYLIDEAHMLSKAAFNAFLKILEEPPASVLFILATTDAQKIIDTVKSRCFQLFFSPIEEQKLLEHLTSICKAERISYEQSGLNLVVKATQGSARDAINLLEQVRYSTNNVTKDAVITVLGHIDDDRLIALFNTVLTQGPGQLLQLLQAIKLQSYNADFIWQKLLEIARTALWLKHGVEPEHTYEYTPKIKRLVTGCSFKQLNNLLDIFYSNEQIFLRTTSQHAFIEMILLTIAQKNERDNSGTSSLPQQAQVADIDDVQDDEALEDEDEIDEEDDDVEEDEIENRSPSSSWQQFLFDIEALKDPLLNSVFKQGICLQFNEAQKIIDVQFSKELVFFKDWLDNTQHAWKPFIEKNYGTAVTLNPIFSLENTKPAAQVVAVPKTPVVVEQKNDARTLHKPMVKPQQQNSQNQQNKNAYYKTRPSYQQTKSKHMDAGKTKNPIIDVSDVTVWKKAHILLHYFPGVIREIKESVHDQKN